MTISNRTSVTYRLSAEDRLALVNAVIVLKTLAKAYEEIYPTLNATQDFIMKKETGEVFNLTELIVGLSTVFDTDNSETEIISTKERT